MQQKPQHQMPSRRYFLFSDDFLQFFLPIFDDEWQRRSEAFEEEDEPLFHALGFEGWPDDNLDEDSRFDDDKIDPD